jgi:predicted ester cyclase
VDAVNERDYDRVSELAGGRIAAEAERWIGPFTESFPDFRMEVVDVIAEGDRVVGHFRCSGTHEGEWRGRPPTGRRFEGVDEIYVFSVRDGKLAEATAVVEDNLTRLQQLGLVD